LANLLFLEGVRISPLSVTIPMLGLTPAFAAVLGIPTLGEVPTLRLGIGIGLVVVGALLLNARSAELKRPWRLFAALFRERGSLYMVVVALLWAITPLLDKVALRHVGIATHACVLSLGVGIGLCGYLALRGEVGSMRGIFARRTWLVAAVVAASLALGFQFAAIKIVYVSWFESIKRSISMSVSVVTGRVFFGEPVLIGKVLAVIVMGSGVLLLI
jgi:uncharacterized membrane protein